MPWKTGDVDKHAKGLTDQQKAVWVKVANSALARCQADGGQDCEATAIRAATALAKKTPRVAKEAEQLSAALTSLLPLDEKGRVLSGKNESALRSALSALQQVLAQIADAEPDEKAADEAIESARELLEAEFSASDKQTALRTALKDANPSSKRWYWVQDLFDTFFIYEDDGAEGAGPMKLYKRTYVIAEDGKVTLGDPVEVRRKTVYEPVGTVASESADVEVAGDFIPLVEKAVRRDSTVPLKLIQPGWGSSGYYGAEMLERDGPKVFKTGTKMYWDHPTATEESERPERSLRDLAAELVSDAKWDPKGPAGPGLYASAKVFGGFKEAVDDLAPHIGVSIRALGKGKTGEAEGRKGPVIESIVAAKSVDFVTAPGAGGQVLSLFESARGGATRPNPPKESQVTEEEARALREANTAAIARLGVLEARAIRAEAREFAREQLDAIAEASRLPAAAKSRVLGQVLADVPVAEGELDREAFKTRIVEAATAEATYLGQVVGSGAIRGMGAAAPVEVTEAAAATALEESFRSLGLSETAAKIAAGGRS